MEEYKVQKADPKNPPKLEMFKLEPTPPQGPKVPVPESPLDCFMLFFAGEIENHLLESSNQRRLRRIEARQESLPHKSRGRPKTSGTAIQSSGDCPSES